MVFHDLLKQVARRAMGGDEAPAWPPSELVRDGVEAVVDAVEPRIRMLPRYRAKLEDGVRGVFLHLRAMGCEKLVDPLELSPKAWSIDRSVNAYFAGPQDIVHLAGRCNELRAFFDSPKNGGLDAAYMLLGMTVEERTIFAPALNGERVVHDVRQTSISFSEHLLLSPSPSFQEARVEIGCCILLRLASEAAERIAKIQEQASDLAERKAMLATKLRALQARQGGLSAMAREPDLAEKITALERSIVDTGQELRQTKTCLSSLDDYVEQINQVLRKPQEFISLSDRAIRVNRMGIRVDDNMEGASDADELHFTEVTLGQMHRAIEIVRFPKAYMPPKVDFLAQADRYF